MHINTNPSIPAGEHLSALILRVRTHRGNRIAIANALEKPNLVAKVSEFLKGQIIKIDNLIIEDQLKIRKIIDAGYNPNNADLDLALQSQLRDAC